MEKEKEERKRKKQRNVFFFFWVFGDVPTRDNVEEEAEIKDSGVVTLLACVENINYFLIM